MTLLREHLAACGNIIAGVRSHYWWQGEISSDAESFIVMETTEDRRDQLMTRLRAIHPYECPKIIALRPDAVDPDYAAWTHAVTRPG